MDLYILGIGGTFMGHLALLAKQLGLKVSGCDKNVYSPMREMLRDNDIQYDEGYDIQHLKGSHKLYVVGNAISRGNPMIEKILNERRPFTSGPAWLKDHILQSKWVIGIAGTHGKTTTTSMVTWILKQNGLKPGYLIGGAAKGFEYAADIGDSEYFVIESDEYDTAFFDKRSKFIHYQPKTLVLNNLEFDHADIFDSIEDIKKTMHHLVRTVAGEGVVIYPENDSNLQQVIQKGCWSHQYGLSFSSNSSLAKDSSAKDKNTFDRQLHGIALNDDASKIRIELSTAGDVETVDFNWQLIGQHNLANAVAAIAAALHIGISLKDAASALSSFGGVKRRMDLRFQLENLNVYDDFAHHPTAIATSLAGLRAKVGQEKIIAFIEPRSNTMSMGVHQQHLLNAVKDADLVYWLKHPKLGFDLSALCAQSTNMQVFDSAEAMLDEALSSQNSQQQHWLCMSNGAFGGLFDLIQQRTEAVTA